MMTLLQQIPMAILAFFGWLFAAPASAAQGKVGKSSGFNFLSALCGILFAVAISSAAFANGDSRALVWAAYKGDIAKVKQLTNDGANVNYKAKVSGWTPLMRAAGEEHTEIALFLINAGAHINTKDNTGLTALHYAVANVHPKTALALIKAGADIEAKNNNGRTPLHLSANSGKTRIARALVKAGADLYARDNDELTPLDIAIELHGEDSFIALILGAKPQKVAPKNRRCWSWYDNDASHIFQRICGRNGEKCDSTC